MEGVAWGPPIVTLAPPLWNPNAARGDRLNLILIVGFCPCPSLGGMWTAMRASWLWPTMPLTWRRSRLIGSRGALRSVREVRLVRWNRLTLWPARMSSPSLAALQGA